MLIKHRTISCCVAAVLALITVVLLPQSSGAAGCKTNTFTDSGTQVFTVGTSKSCNRGDGAGSGNDGPAGDSPSSRGTDGSAKPGVSAAERYAKRYTTVAAQNLTEVIRYGACAANQPYYVNCQDPRFEALPQRPAAVPAPARPPGETLPPEVVAYAAVARLRLVPPKPVIGPPPSINPWNMAAVGYPLWLSVDGNPNPPAATDRVYDLSVSIRARLSSVTFATGDGKSVTCTDLTHVWRRHEVRPGTPSPTCGYTYTKPSLPAGKYTVTAYSTWSVDVTINGRVIPVTYRQQGTTTLPVGELQVTVR